MDVSNNYLNYAQIPRNHCILLLIGIWSLTDCTSSNKEFQTNNDGKVFCDIQLGKSYDYQDLLFRFHNFNVRSVARDSVNQEITIQLHPSGSDTCWQILVYNKKKGRVSGCSRDCQ